jgi:hypothetical protein
MFHLFQRIYLDHDSHVHSRSAMMVLSSKEKPHPISTIAGRSLGSVAAFDQVLKEDFQDSLEVFWKFVISRDPTRDFVLFVDDELYFQFQIQYWRSILAEPSPGTLYELYNVYRTDYELKIPTAVDRGENPSGTYRNLYPRLTQAEFEARIAHIGSSSVLRQANLAEVSIEYLLADFFSDPRSDYREGLKKKVLQMAWRNWFNDIEELRSEVLAGASNLDQLYPDLAPVLRSGGDPMAILKSDERFAWLHDERFSRRDRHEIRLNYPADYFPTIQALVDRICRIRVRLKGLETEDVDTFNQASETRLLYADDFEGIIRQDVERCFGSFFLKGRRYADINHFLIGTLYRMVRAGRVEELRRLRLAEQYKF